MKFLLDGEDLWELVNKKDTEQTSITQGAQTRNRTRTLSPGPAIDENKRRKCKKATYLIYQSCSTLPQSYIAHEKDPARMWTILENLYSRTNDDETGQVLFEEFWTEQFQKYKTIEKTYQNHGQPYNQSNRAKEKDCWYCTLKGHTQKGCRIRQRAEEMQKGRKKLATITHTAIADTNADTNADIQALIAEASADPEDRITFYSD